MTTEVTPQPETTRVRKVVRRKRRHHRRSWWSRWKERARRWLNSGTGFFVLLVLIAAAIAVLFMLAER